MTPAVGSLPGGAAAGEPHCDGSPEETDSTSETQTEKNCKCRCVDVRAQRLKVKGYSERYRGLSVDQSADVRWRQEADLLQQVAGLPEHNSDL